MFDWYILSVANPDGYEYSHTEVYVVQRGFRTECGERRGHGHRHYGSAEVLIPTGTSASNGTVSSTAISGPVVVDLPAQPIRPCAETYAGTRAFSEPETKAIADFILRNKHRLKAFLNFHSYSQLWMTPWGYTALRPAQYKDMVGFCFSSTPRWSKPLSRRRLLL
ncbi:SLC6A2 [Cordylochernes scorpioides]|uniref:SLC6A2 n=1 Tax=Cordylochernes scorpioides TaxID=51811 RepID=A0ABY6JWJ4_9ARAC|nr:SLC6A2 [Cordylochernes scorpioides]